MLFFTQQKNKPRNVTKKKKEKKNIDSVHIKIDKILSRTIIIIILMIYYPMNISMLNLLNYVHHFLIEYENLPYYY